MVNIGEKSKMVKGRKQKKEMEKGEKGKTEVKLSRSKSKSIT